MYRSKLSTSYGIIVYTYDHDELKFLMTLRRDTFCYECLIRGMYASVEVLKDYISHITKEERDRIIKYPFDMLWKDLWVSPKRRLYRVEYKKASDKFQQHKQLILQLVTNMVDFDPPSWEFAKGKMFSDETPLQCALREFQEETTINKNQISLVKHAGTYQESFFGNDQKKYQSLYYLGRIDNGLSIPIAYQDCPHQMRNPYLSDEVMSIGWFSFDDSLELCSPTKKLILYQIKNYLCGIKQ